MEEDRKALEELVIDNPDLERLEALLDEFNIFEVLGAVRVELRHSEFLAYLMDPNQNHGMSDDFVKRFLQKSLLGVDQNELPVTALDLDIWNLDDLEVRREWQNIDILLVSESNDLVVVIENKIGSGEHSNQLQRYRKDVEQHYPESRKLFIFLTPEGEEPSDEKYISINYDLVCELIESLVESRKTSLGPDIRTMMEHYTKMLRRHILSGSEIEELSRKLYRKHKRALDIIFDYKPDIQVNIQDYLIDLINQQEDIILDVSSKSYIRFAVKEWDTPVLLEGQGWTKSNRILLFEFKNSPTSLGLYLLIGPGPHEIRQKLYNLSQTNNSPLNSSYKKLYDKFQTIFVHHYFKKKDLEGTEIDDLKIKIDKEWKKFLGSELPKIREIMKDQEWLWE